MGCLPQGTGSSASGLLAEVCVRPGWVSTENGLHPENLELVQFGLHRKERARGNAKEKGGLNGIKLK